MTGGDGLLESASPTRLYGSLGWPTHCVPCSVSQPDFLGRASPIKRDMLTGLAGPVPLEPIGLHVVGRGLAPGCHLSRSHFGARGVQELDACPRRRGGTRQRLGSRDHFAGYLGAPIGEVMGHFKGNRHKLQPTDFPDQGGKGGHEAARLPRKDPLERVALPLVGPRIDVETERRVGLPSPDVAIKLRDSDDIEAVNPDVPIRTLADVIGQHAFTVIVRWWLCELARTRDVAAAHVEPIPLHPPLRNVRHGRAPFCQENCSASGRLYPPGRCEGGSCKNSAMDYGITSLRMHKSSILPHRKINRAVSRAYPLPKISSG